MFIIPKPNFSRVRGGGGGLHFPYGRGGWGGHCWQGRGVLIIVLSFPIAFRSLY